MGERNASASAMATRKMTGDWGLATVSNHGKTGTCNYGNKCVRVILRQGVTMAIDARNGGCA